MTEIKKHNNLVPDLKNTDLAGMVQLVQNEYDKNGLSPELELQFIQMKINEDARLLRASKANPESLYNSILQAAQSGLSLNPQWLEGYFVPYNMKIDGKDVPTITFSPMYRGKKKLLISKGIVKNIISELVYEGEEFEEDIINGVHQIKHKPNSFSRSDHSKIIGGYAAIFLNNGEMQYVVKGRDYFERCKKASEQKMNGKTSPAWRMWYDQMCLKCLINAADSVIPKIGVDSKTTKLLNSINTQDIDFVDVTNQRELDSVTFKDKKTLSDDDFEELLSQLLWYQISLASARQKYHGYAFTPDQKAKIKEAGTITEERLTEIIRLVLDGNNTLEYFEFYLSDAQFSELRGAVLDNDINDEK